MKKIEQLDTIFQIDYSIKNELNKQSLFNMFLNYALNMGFVNFIGNPSENIISLDFVIDYATKLKNIGMKFYWTHLLVDNYRTYNNALATIFNNHIVDLGIENPNQELYSDNIYTGSTYSPLYSLVKIPENFLQYSNTDLVSLKKELIII